MSRLRFKESFLTHSTVLLNLRSTERLAAYVTYFTTLLPVLNVIHHGQDLYTARAEVSKVPEY